MVNDVSKICSKCQTELPLSLFYKDRTRNNLRAVCKTCTNLQACAWRKNNKERKSLKDREYRLLNQDKIKEYQAVYYSLNKSDYARRQANRKAARLRATPEWLTDEHKEEINYIYKLRDEASCLSDYTYHVDHIVPLQGKNVCGLHVPWNLQLLYEEVNLAKNNSF